MVFNRRGMERPHLHRRGPFKLLALIMWLLIAVPAMADSDTGPVEVVTTETNIDGTWQLPSKRVQVKSVIHGDFQSGVAEGWNDTTILGLLYLEQNATGRGLASRWGRQASTNGGLYGSFDGARLSYRMTNRVRLNLITGLPVEHSQENTEADTYFYGFNADFGRYLEQWDLHTFYLHEMSEGLTDRQAVGGSIQWSNNGTHLLSSVDYDFLFNEINRLLLDGNWLFPNRKTRMTASGDFRKSQTLRTRNALIGQEDSSLQALARDQGTSRIYQLARDRTRNNRRVSLGLTHPTSTKYQVAGDVSWVKEYGSPASGGVDALAPTGDELYYSAELIGSGLVRNGDRAVVGLHYGNTIPQDSYSLSLNTLYPLQDNWQINPRMQVDYLAYNDVNRGEWRFQPAMGMEYLLRSHWKLDVEGGVNIVDEELGGLTDDEWRYFVSMGLRKQF